MRECAAQKRSSEPHAEMDIQETNRELECQRLSFISRISMDRQRERINFCGELEMINRLFQESRARNCLEIVELRKNCCEQTDRARLMGIDELSMQQERGPTMVSQLLTQIQDLQNQVNSLSDAGEFLRSRNNEQLWSIPRSQSALDHSESQRYALPRLLLAA